MIFKDSSYQKQFDNNGFVILPLLSAEEVKELLRFFEEEYVKSISGFHSTHFLTDEKIKRNVHDLIVKLCEDKLTKILKDYSALFANFMVKNPGEGSIMPLHADWTYVDEAEYTSLGVWCPLVDTNQENGMLGVIPQSHLLKRNLRGPKIPTPFHDHNQYIIDNYGKLLPIKSGNIVIYDHRLLHFSPPNLSDMNRVAFNLVMTPCQAKISHYASLDSYPEIYKYENLDPGFFIKYNHFEAPDESLFSGKIELNVIPFSQEEIDNLLKKKSLFSFFARWLS